jgi:hypothetical protein
VLSDILVLDVKVLAYNAFITSYRCVFIVDDSKVLTLLYLCKGNCGIISFDNPFIELEVVSGSEMLAFLRYKLHLFQACLLFFSEIVVSNEEGVVSL